MIMLIFLCTIMTGCSENDELVRYAKSDVNQPLTTIRDPQKVNIIKSIMTHIHWGQKQHPAKNYVYSIWFEKKGDDLRKFNYRFWVDHDKVLVFDPTHYKFGYVDHPDTIKLEKIIPLKK